VRTPHGFYDWVEARLGNLMIFPPVGPLHGAQFLRILPLPVAGCA